MKKILIIASILTTTIYFSTKTEASNYGQVSGENIYWNYETDFDFSYYSSLKGLTADAFRAELNDIITEGFVWRTYNTSDRYTILPEADAVYGKEGYVYCIYSGQIFRDIDCSTSLGGSYLWNTEHVWAKSHGFPSTSQIPYSDYHHLRVCDTSTNSRRNNRFIGSLDGQDYSMDVWGNKYTTDTWEPLDNVKGDVARMLLYMDVRYDGEVSNDVDLVLLDDYDFPDTTGDPYMSNLDDLIQWHYDDPVDDQERYRNDVIYSYQNNRNPFIDCPEYVAAVWGDSVYNEIDIFDTYIDLLDNNNLDIHSIARGFVLYNNLDNSQKILVTNYEVLLDYYNIYILQSDYSEEEIKVILSFYVDYVFLETVLNGNFYDLENFT